MENYVNDSTISDLEIGAKIQHFYELLQEIEDVLTFERDINKNHIPIEVVTMFESLSNNYSKLFGDIIQ